jgi:hypothetical protein
LIILDICGNFALQIQMISQIFPSYGDQIAWRKNRKCLLGNYLKIVGSNGKRQIAWMEMGRIIKPMGIF